MKGQKNQDSWHIRGFSGEPAEVGPAEFQKFFKTAQKGDASAQFHVGTLYLSGQGVPQNNGEALKWLRKASEQGSVKARYMIGNCYSHGWGVPKSEREAATHWRQAAAQGLAAAQYNLGFSYMYAEGVPPDAA